MVITVHLTCKFIFCFLLIRISNFLTSFKNKQNQRFRAFPGGVFTVYALQISGDHCTCSRLCPLPEVIHGNRTANVVAIWGGAFGMWPGPEGGASRTGPAPLEETPEPPHPAATWGHAGAREWVLRHQTCCHRILGFPASELWEIYYQPPHQWYFLCQSSLTGLSQSQCKGL